MIIHDDILHWAALYDGPKFHALLCDAPYHLTEISNRFGSADAAPAQHGKDGAFQRLSKGFMGKHWDGVDEDGVGIAFNPEMWKAVANHLHPGAYLFVFCGTLNDDLISMAMRAAGLRKHHKSLAWGYGSGFPKATRLDTAIDRRAGVERTTVGTRKHAPKFDAKGHGYREKDNGFNSRERETFDVTAPATQLAEMWQGHRYGLQSIKPAIEPILIFQKPYGGDAVDTITATGAGALWIDGARIGGEAVRTNGFAKQGTATYGNYSGLSEPSEWREGRWPANLMLSHLPGCNGHCEPGCAVAALAAQSGESESQASQRGPVNIGAFGGVVDGVAQYKDNATERGHNDAGSAARYFFNADYVCERLEAADAVVYAAKAAQAEREAGLDPRQLALLGMDERDETTINDGRKKAIDNAFQRGKTERRNIHPTIKPISLTRHLATLLLPPAEYAPRRLLVPFAGAGSEMIGAMLAGWEEIVGVELEANHVAIAEARLAYWRQRMHEFGDPAREIRATLADAPDGQMELF